MSRQPKIILAMLMVTLQCQGQLVLKATLKNDEFDARTFISATTGNILSGNLVPETEDIIHSVDNFIYTRNNVLSDIQTIKKYKITKGNAIQISATNLARYDRIAFFQNGAFVVVDTDEAVSMYIKVFSDEFRLINTLIPFASGVTGGFKFHSNGDIIAVGATEVGQKKSKLIAFKSNGELLFEKEISITDSQIIKVLSSTLNFAVLSRNLNTWHASLSVYNSNGEQLWIKPGTDVMEWSFAGLKKPRLVTGNNYSLFEYDATNGNLNAQLEFAKIYQDAGAILAKNKKAADLLAILPRPDSEQVNVLLSEITGGGTQATNNLLFSFKGQLDKEPQYVKISDTKGKLLLKSTTNELMIIKDKEILRYEYVFEK